MTFPSSSAPVAGGPALIGGGHGGSRPYSLSVTPGHTWGCPPAIPATSGVAPSGDGLIRGGDISRADALYPDSFARSGPAMAFHFSVWEAIHDGDRDYAFLSRWSGARDLLSPPETDPLLVFGSRKTRRDFRTWWSRYTRRFNDAEYGERCVPTLAAGRLKGYVIPHEMSGLDTTMFASAARGTATVPAEQRDVWAWIVARGRGPAYRIPGAWVFVNQVDAVAFKLHWI
jgi:hypothetical protein